ncbi:MAG: MOSC domain-containing protein [Rhodothermales bacterium]
MESRVVSLHIYPLKGARAVDLDTVRVQSRGLEGDRAWMLVDADGTFVSQRSVPDLTGLTAHHKTGDSLELVWRGEHHTVPQPTGPLEPVRVWNDIVEAIPADEEANSWLSERLGRTFRLFWMPPTTHRQVDPVYASEGHGTRFTDGYPVLVTTTGSLQSLGLDIPMNRFRPSIVIHTLDAWMEDAWDRIAIGDVELRLVKPCGRCVVTTIDQDTGVAGKEPLTTLARLRKQGSKVLFGENAVVEKAGTIAVGDRVTVLSTKDASPSA